MSMKINRIKYSYNYEEMISEIKEDIEDGVLNLNGNIYIVRANENNDANCYNPIIDYYYLDALDTMNEELNNSIIEGNAEETNKIKSAIKLYEADSSSFEVVRVSDILQEMEALNTII